MTDSRAPRSSPASTERLRLPGVAVVFFVLSVVLLLLGGLTLLGTSSRSFFENAPTQASIGALLLLIGAGALIAGLVLVGVRSLAQQHLDATLHHRARPR
ncbi:hypothetical protein [Microbacterium sp. P02]|uniref:hypothetical protein n=1 Tax=Microbacterium sp. P02 TaxID=3366260 RepID=UPI00366D603A